MLRVLVIVAGVGCGRIGFDTGGEGERDDEVASAYGEAVLEDGPLAYFRFNEAQGPTAVSEVGATAGTYQGAFEYGAIGAVGDSSVVFDGRTTFVELGDSFEFSGNAPYSFELWIFSYGVGNGTRFLLQRRTPAGDGYQLYIGPGYTVFSRSVPDDEFGYVSTTEAPPVERWTHLAVTYDGAAQSLFIDGQLVSNNTGNAALPLGGGAGSFVVGDHIPAQFNKLDGRLDELAIYDYALPADRIRAHHDVVR